MDEQILIHDAVIHFAGCEPTFRLLEALPNSKGFFQVKAIGYYAAVGA